MTSNKGTDVASGLHQLEVFIGKIDFVQITCQVILEMLQGKTPIELLSIPKIFVNEAERLINDPKQRLPSSVKDDRELKRRGRFLSVVKEIYELGRSEDSLREDKKKKILQLLEKIASTRDETEEVRHICFVISHLLQRA